MNSCSGCGETYNQSSGHSCGDTEEMKKVRNDLASALSKINEMKMVIIPIHKHHAGEYNKWRQGGEGKKTLGYIEALDKLGSFLKG